MLETKILGNTEQTFFPCSLIFRSVIDTRRGIQFVIFLARQESKPTNHLRFIDSVDRRRSKLATRARLGESTNYQLRSGNIKVGPATCPVARPADVVSSSWSGPIGPRWVH